MGLLKLTLLKIYYNLTTLGTGGGVLPIASYTGRLCPKGVPLYKRVGEIAILVYERVIKSAAKWKKWWRATFWQR